MEHDSKSPSSRKKDSAVFKNTALGVNANILDLCIRVYAKFLAHIVPFIMHFDRFITMLTNGIITVYELCTVHAFQIWSKSLLEGCKVTAKQPQSGTIIKERNSQKLDAGGRAFAIYQNAGKIQLESFGYVFDFPVVATSGDCFLSLFKKPREERCFLGMSL